MTNKKIKVERIKIRNLKLRVERLINFSQKKILEITTQFNEKVDKVYSLIELAEDKIRKLRLEDNGNKEVPEELDYDFGIDWINNKSTVGVPVKFEKIEDAKEYLNEEKGMEILEDDFNSQ